MAERFYTIVTADNFTYPKIEQHLINMCETLKHMMEGNKFMSILSL